MSRGAWHRAAACLPVFGFAAYPILFIVTVNAGAQPLDGTAIVRSLLVAWGGAATLLLLLRAFPWDFDARAAWAGLAMLLFVFYQPLLAVLVAAGWSVVPHDPLVSAGFVMAILALVTAMVRPWQPRPRSPFALNATLAVLVSVNVYSEIAHDAFGGWRPDVEARTAGVLADQSVKPPERDVYYIVLDGFGRADILETKYQVDLAPFTQFLSTKGFSVPAGARANYSQTYLSLASALNLSYLDDLVATLGEASNDRRPLKHLIDRNALMMAARRAGYRVFAVGSAYSATETIELADVCLCERRGFGELEYQALISTPFAALPLSRWTYDAHRAKILEGLEAVETLSKEPGRKFVFAHVIVPHPPFVFNADGTPRQASRPFSFQDGDQFEGTTEEYVEGYRDQTRYLIDRLTTLVKRLSQQPGPAPVIVMHGDHGPRSEMRSGRFSDADQHERMSIFMAYAFPGSPEAVLDADVTPVNMARSLARRYMGLHVPDLPDASYFSTWEEPYRFIPVTAADGEAFRAGR